MQTFLPYNDFYKSAKVLDYRRLGKQRSEVLTLLNGGWPNHPCARMWKGYEWKLAFYGLVICFEWRNRGYQDNTTNKIFDYMKSHKFELYDYPPWFGLYEFHRSHQSNLIRKNPEYYSKFFPNVPDNLPYEWNEQYWKE